MAIRPTDDQLQAALDSVDALRTEIALPGAANAARRVFRRETEIHGARFGSTWIAQDEAPWLAICGLDGILPKEALGACPRGTFRVVVEFEPDE
jgi:hypothetical protein